MFRGYRGDIGFVYDHLMSTKSESDAVSADVGIGTYFHGGVDLNQNNAYTQTGPWIKDNALKQSIDFKNPILYLKLFIFGILVRKPLIQKTSMMPLGVMMW